MTPQNDRKTKIAIAAADIESEIKAKQLAEKLQLKFVSLHDLSYDYLLIVTASHLELKKVNSSEKPLIIDFLAGSLAHRLDKLQRELIAKAIGKKANEKIFVIDATAGLGRDGFLLATLGCKVLMLERSLVMAELLQDGLQRALLTYKDLEIQLITTDAISYLQKLPEKDFPDVIYLDPMYPERTKSALVKKEMRYLREIVGSDEDATRLLVLALKHAKKRVVVKRPRLAPALPGPAVNFSVTGKNVRFDVYLKIVPSPFKGEG